MIYDLRFTIYALIVAVLLLVPACNTVTPVTPKSAVASPDGTQFNSGVIDCFTNGPLAGTCIVSANWHRRYNEELIPRFGTNWHLHADDGMTAYTNGTWLVDAQHHFYFSTMNRWLKARPAP